MISNQPLFDIVVPVFDSLSSVKNCLHSVLQHSSLPFRLIIVNDASDVFTSDFLRKLAEIDSRIHLLENESNLGFLKTANRGLQFSLESSEICAPYVMLLNSDVMVTPFWLEAFANCFAFDPLIAVACPVSNAAENFSLKMPAGDDFLSIAKKIYAQVTPRYPDITTAIGFCMAFRREIVQQLGFFDEAFQRGYAEDTDYHFRVIADGKRVVLVDNCFVYHEGGASFQQEKNLLIQQNRQLFDERWSTIYRKEILHHDSQTPLAPILDSLQTSSPEDLYDVIFFLPISALSGGIIVVYETIQRLIILGLKTTAIILEEEREIEIPLSFSPYFHPEGSQTKIPKAKIYVATHFRTVPYCLFALRENPAAQLVYLIQGYEGWFPNSILDYVTNSYSAIENRIVVSTWLQKMLARWGCDSMIIPNGVDSSFFRPGQRYSDSQINTPLRVLMLLRDDPQRSLTFARQLLERLQINSNFELWGIGEASTQLNIESLLDQALGPIDRRTLAKTLQQVDVFVDCSMMQGFGLMGLEAMSAGVAAVLSETGGVLEYANRENSILCAPGSVDALETALIELQKNPERLRTLKTNGRKTAVDLDWDRSARHYYNYFVKLFEAKKEPGKSLASRETYLLSQVERHHRIMHVLKKAGAILKDELAALIPKDQNNNGFEFLKSRLAPEQIEFLLESDEGHLLVEFYEATKKSLARKENRLEIVRENVGLDQKKPSLLEKIIDATQSLK